MATGSLDQMTVDAALPPAVFHSAIHAQQLARRTPPAEAGFVTLRELLLLAAGVEAATQDYIDSARRNGATWAQIGAALGLSRQGAQQRWGKSRNDRLATPDHKTADTVRQAPIAR